MITKRQAIWVTFFGLASALPDNSLGLLLKLIFTHTPLVGGLASSSMVGALLYIGTFLAPRLGAGLLYMLVFMAVAVFTPSFGPPGVYKMLIALILGLYIELVLYAGRYRRSAYLFCVSTAVPASLPATYLVWSLTHVYGDSFSLAASLSGFYNGLLLGLYLATGVAGAFLGDFIFRKRIASISTVAAIREGQ